MKQKLFIAVVLFISMAIGIAACTKKDVNSTLPAVTDYSFSEDFDTVSKAVARGWMIVNNTKPIGTMAWVQGFYYLSMHHGIEPGKLGGSENVNYSSTGGFGGSNPSFSGADFIMTTANCGTGKAVCSNWLISPETIMKDGDEISFYTRTYQYPALAADQLEVRINTTGGTVETGTTATSVGSFNQLLLAINPNLVLEGEEAYPEEWTKYTVKISGLPAPKKARIALRYFVPDGGPLGKNSTGIGIDKFSFSSF
ncbi:MAG TPA: choice-of-anchor J domain-containing protein [Ferruginibacter sp.]|nr:choice-of-anchor J domain-containing protein [Ferruginibacter sp.]HMP20251.1 choice-of-anchor J domain-containing protein [Ferruginibacter sp.]